MTVGIGATYNGDDPAVVLIADRMVTTGAVEHEHSDGKLEMVSAGNPAVAAVAAGTLSYADELYYRVGNRILDESPDTVQAVGEFFVEEMHEIIRSEANNQILADYDLTLNELTNQGVPLSDDMVSNFLAQVTELKITYKEVQRCSSQVLMMTTEVSYSNFVMVVSLDTALLDSSVLGPEPGLRV